MARPQTKGPKRLSYFSGSTRREFAVRLGRDGSLQAAATDGRGPISDDDRHAIERYADRLVELLATAEDGKW